MKDADVDVPTKFTTGLARTLGIQNSLPKSSRQLRACLHLQQLPPDVTKRNLNRGSTLPNNAWDALQHRFDNNWSLFPEKTRLYRGTVTPRSLSLSVTASVTSHRRAGAGGDTAPQYHPDEARPQRQWPGRGRKKTDAVVEKWEGNHSLIGRRSLLLLYRSLLRPIKEQTF